MVFSETILVGAFFISLVVGFLTGVFGVGGGFLMAPGLIILLNIPSPTAIGTELMVILVNSSFGMLRRRGSSTVDIKLALTIAVGSVPGVFVGSAILEYLKNLAPILVNGHEVVAINYVLLWSFFVLLSSIALFLLIDFRKNMGQSLPQRIGLFARLNFRPFGHYSSLEEPRLSILPLIGLGLMIGMMTGMMGIGGGVILLPGLIFLVGQRTIKAAGTSLLLIWIASLVAVVNHIKYGNIHLHLWTAMVIGGLTGTFFGTQLGLKMSDYKLRLSFIFVVGAAILLVAYELYRVTFLVV